MQTRRGAEAYERVLRARFLALEDRGLAPFTEQSMIFSSFAERWFQDYVIPTNRFSTRVTKARIFKKYLLPAFGERPLHGVTGAEIDRLAASMVAQGRSAKTVNNAMSVLRTSLSSAVRWNLLASLPKIPELPAAPPAYRYLSTNEARDLVDATKPGYWRTLIVFLLHTGCRFGEAAALKWEDIEFDAPAARIRIQRSASLGLVGPTKTGKVRDIPITADVVAVLRELPRNHEYVFALPEGALPSSAKSNKHLKKLCERAGIRRISWHALRHTFATELVARQVPLRAVQDLLGHASIAMTCRYAHVADRTLQAAVAVLPSMIGPSNGRSEPTRGHEMYESAPAVQVRT